MTRSLIALPLFALITIGVAGPAQAVPAMPRRDTTASLQSLAQSPALVAVRYYRHLYGHHHHHHHWRAASRPAREDDGVKTGQWQFTSELAAPAPAAGAQSPAPESQAASARGQPQTDSGAKTTYMACIASDKAVPAGIDPRCKLDGTQRQGSRVTWSMSCANTRVRSDGVARYHGDTMDGTMVSHMPAANGAAMEMTQQITGRYIGPCLQAAQNQMPPAQTMPTQTMPTQTMQASNESGGSLSPVAQSPAAPEGAAAQQAGDENTAAIAPSRESHASRHVRHHVRYRHYARHRYWRYYHRWY